MKMMTKKHILLTFLICGCAPALAQPRAVSVNPSERFQTIDNFTASDAWSGEFVGRYWIRPECYTAFAGYLADVAAHYLENGWKVSMYRVFSELDSDLQRASPRQ